ncbi:HNH endonuclease signature motif containing protein [Herbiconiux ginsengi]|uniref:HNH nuclease domain-containing protein n=1 Tax=Herbiconiux ginsengi TaxID=381665 RepID=A0A1H3S8X8_9MICO|nr:HNH endonuclease signature motif containing protein [Herbiconiux ginsengi]SDZ34354.1 protein of unknown function [Herbiconiux ginsengi]
MPIAPRLDSVFADLGVDLGAVLSADPGGLSDAGLLAEVAGLERLGRLVDAARVRFAGEVGARSRPELGDEGLSRSQNFTSPAKLVSAVAGVSVAESQKRLALGQRLRGALQLGGVQGPEPFPRVSEGLNRGVLAVEAAVVITKQCAHLIGRGLPADAVAEAEQSLVEETVTWGLTPDQTAALAVRLRELLDPDGAAPRDEVLQQQRSLTFSRSADGMVRGRFALTPEQAGVWCSSIEALQSPRITRPGSSGTCASGSDPDRSGAAGSGVATPDAVGPEGADARVTGPRFVSEDEYVTQTITADDRTPAQKNVDTVTELIARAAAAPDMPHLNGSTTTVNVHVTLADLEAGRGVGWIDGIEEPVPVAAIEQLRCHAPVVTTVLGDRGEVLHLGKTRRLFSPAQNRALAARDGGCVWHGCDRPPAWCETHHVTEWASPDHLPGRTDIDNGVLLCHFHHSHLHKSAWKLIMHAGVPHLVPPRWRDPEQTPIPTTRRRTTLPPRHHTAA